KIHLSCGEVILFSVLVNVKRVTSGAESHRNSEARSNKAGAIVRPPKQASSFCPGRSRQESKDLMAKIISIHSFRGGTGKSNVTANLAMLLAQSGRRVGVVDTDLQSPGLHVLFGLEEEQHTLNEYLWGKCAIKQTAYDVTSKLKTEIAGKVYLIPASSKTGEIARILREGYDV